MYRRHHVEDYGVRICGGGVPRNRNSVEVVHAGLHEQVRHCKNSILYPCGNSEHEHVSAGGAADVFPCRTQRTAVLSAHKVYDYQHSRKILSDNACGRNACSRHSADYHEEQVERNIQRSGNRQEYQRQPCFAGGAEKSAAEIVHRHGRHAEGVYPEVRHGVREQLRLCLEERQHRLRQQQAHQADYHAGHSAHQQRGVHRHAHALSITCAEPVSRPDIDPCAHTDKNSGEKRHQQGRGANGSKRYVVGEFARYRNIAEVEEHLQQLCHHQRQAEQKYILPQRA